MQVFKLLVDFGLVVLIWMTQLIVYPGFGHYTPEGLLQWHSKYTVAVSIIVAPLMLAQVAFHGWSIFHDQGIINWINIFFIVLIWINTFGFAVPLHNQIGAGESVLESAHRLVSVNWYRTVLWSVILGLSLYQYFNK